MVKVLPDVAIPASWCRQKADLQGRRLASAREKEKTVVGSVFYKKRHAKIVRQCDSG